MRIQTLSAVVANQIAAGEVIENPASVVKELLENALDAGATAITIEIGFGGLNQIKISDNGIGIVADDLPLAIAPHATSKLTQLSDLSILTSMGFRGEALASIASISRITIRSKPRDQDHAMMLHMDGEAVELSPCARSQGTTIDVRDLFYNAPVRRRFLKSERSEYLAIEHVVKRFALSAPAISLVLKHNEKQMLDLPAATHEHSLRVRVQRLLGKSFMEHAISVDVERAGMRLTGWISGLAYQRSQNDKQWIYLNQRMVKDKLIQHAFKQAYENKLYPGRFPACLLYLSMPTADVDVNVHPTKHEVRFQQPRLVHDFIGSQIADALMSASCEDALFDTALREPNNIVVTNSDNGLAGRHGEANDNSENNEFLHAPMILKETITAYSPLPLAGEGLGAGCIIKPLSSPTLLPPAGEGSKRFQKNYIPRLQAAEMRMSHQHLTSWTILNSQFGLFTWQGQSYLFDIQQAQEKRCLWLIQQSDLPLPSRPLLVPLSIEHDSENSECLNTSFEACKTYGMHIEMNDSHVIIRTIPVSMPQLAIKPLLMKVLEQRPLEEEMPRLLARFQPTDVSQLDAFEKEALIDYVMQQLEQGSTLDAWCVCLDVKRCQELFSA